jgi:D-alanyl-D-alanine carboxypeptidase (penicillin-binding protein 5/6)
MKRWLTAVLLFAGTMTACGGAPAVIAPGNADAAPFFAEPEATQTATPSPVPTPTPKPSSRDSSLRPAPWAPVPLPRTNVGAPQPQAAAAVVMDEASGAVLFERDADVSLAPASLTKIATAVVALELGGDLDRRVTVDVDSRAMPGSTVMGLLPGDEFTLRDLLYGLMLPSGNDAALAIGRAVSGSDSAFVAQMNMLMLSLGLVESHFTNPHGLGGNGHVMSAYDLAALTRYAMQMDGFKVLASTRAWTARGSRLISMTNLNNLLGAYSGADGVKVGYTGRAGHTLVASASRNGHRVIVVLLNAPAAKDDASKLLDWAFANYIWPQS